MKKISFINFLESLKNNDNKNLIENIREGFNACFEALDPKTVKKSEGYDETEWYDLLEKYVRRRTKKTLGLRDFEHLDFDEFYDNDLSIRATYNKLIKPEIDEGIKRKDPKIIKALKAAGAETPALGIASGLAGMGRSVGKMLRRKS